jgi:hypothetical protein
MTARAFSPRSSTYTSMFDSTQASTTITLTPGPRAPRRRPDAGTRYSLRPVRSLPTNLIFFALRRVLAMLLVNTNRTISTDSLVEAIWGDAPPLTARRQVQNEASAPSPDARPRRGADGSSPDPVPGVLRVRRRHRGRCTTGQAGDPPGARRRGCGTSPGGRQRFPLGPSPLARPDPRRDREPGCALRGGLTRRGAPVCPRAVHGSRTGPRRSPRGGGELGGLDAVPGSTVTYTPTSATPPNVTLTFEDGTTQG